MSVTVNENDNKINIESAKAAYENEEYIKAAELLMQLWTLSEKNDTYLLSFLGRSLRKANRCVDFVEICRSIAPNNKILKEKYVNSILCWCLYDAYIKPFKDSKKDEYEEFIKKAKYITNSLSQLDAEQQFINPYVLTIIKVVKIMKCKASIPYKQIIEWLSLLDPQNLSSEGTEKATEYGETRRFASTREFYYYVMSKAYEKIGDYEKCIEACDGGLEKVKELHYGNNVWLRARKYYCECLLTNDAGAIENYKKIANNERHWYMFHKLSSIYYRNAKVEEALLYASKALTKRFEKEKMVNLLQDVGVLWIANSNKENAKIFLQASGYYRVLMEWNMPEELEYYINEFELNVKNKPDKNMIKKISTSYIENIEGKKIWETGYIDNIKIDGGYGFLTPSKGGDNIYFRLKKIKGNVVLKKGDKVEYQKEIKDGRTFAIMVKRS